MNGIERDIKWKGDGIEGILAVKKMILKDFRCRKKFRMIVSVRTERMGRKEKGEKKKPGKRV